MRNEPIKAIFETAGYPCDYNRRNRWFKALAELVDSGLLTFGICEKGKVWSMDDNPSFKYNIVVRGCSRRFRRYVKTNTITPYDVLLVAGKFLQDSTVKQQIVSHVNLDLSCDRCNGVGFISMFKHYCDGICFECYGTGYSKHKKIEVKIYEKAN